MQLSYNDKEYDIVIEKKKSNKNTYIRVKKDLKPTPTTDLHSDPEQDYFRSQFPYLSMGENNNYPYMKDIV